MGKLAIPKVPVCRDRPLSFIRVGRSGVPHGAVAQVEQRTVIWNKDDESGNKPAFI